MRKENYIQSVIIVVLVAAIVVMSVGYALYAQTLNINGTATFTKASWDVHFDNSTYSETSTIQSNPAASLGDTSISYTVTLPSPGSTYSFTVNAKNFGTIDAKLTKITLAGLSTEQKKYITYKVSYNGTEYTETTDGLSVALASGASHPVVVTVSYVLPTNAADLPTTQDTVVDLALALDYADNAS